MTKEHLSFKSKKGIILIIISTFVSSIAVMMDTIVIRQYDPFSYLGIVSFFVTLTLLIIFPGKIKTFAVLKDRRDGSKTVLYSFLWTIQGGYVLSGTAGRCKSIVPGSFCTLIRSHNNHTCIHIPEGEKICETENNRIHHDAYRIGVIEIGMVLH
jgi:hypothetical protein